MMRMIRWRVWQHMPMMTRRILWRMNEGVSCIAGCRQLAAAIVEMDISLFAASV